MRRSSVVPRPTSTWLVPLRRAIDPRTGARIPRRITFRVLLFLVVLGGLAYAGYASIRWYVNNSYFVGLSHNQVVIYQGRPGGFVGMNPKIVKRTQMTARQVPSYKIPDLRSGVQEPSLQSRRRIRHEPASSRCAPWTNPPPTARPPNLPPGATTSTTIPTSTPATFGMRPTGPARHGSGGEAA